MSWYLSIINLYNTCSDFNIKFRNEIENGVSNDRLLGVSIFYFFFIIIKHLKVYQLIKDWKSELYNYHHKIKQNYNENITMLLVNYFHMLQRV
jgi:hypothetical protein